MLPPPGKSMSRRSSYVKAINWGVHNQIRPKGSNRSRDGGSRFINLPPPSLCSIIMGVVSQDNQPQAQLKIALLW